MDSNAALLVDIPLFSKLPPDMLAHLASVARDVEIAAGQVLFRDGDPGDTLYVLKTGRVEVLVDEQVVRSHGRGEAMGELALLSGGRRTATVRARRDSSMLALDRAEFDGLLSGQPEFALALIRELALRQPRADAPPPKTSAAVLALIGLHDDLAPLVALLADKVAAELTANGTLARMDAAEPGVDPAVHLDGLEARHDRVLLVSGSPQSEWTRFCLRQADQVLAVVDPARTAPTGEPLVTGCELVALSTIGLEKWLDMTSPRACHLIGGDTRSLDVARMVRRLTGRALGLVLSGGGARGLAHIGVIDVFRRAGLGIDRVGGTSMGAFISGLTAAGLDVDEMLAVCRREVGGGRVFKDYTWPRHSLIKAQRGNSMLDRVFGDMRIEQARCTMFCVSVDLISAQEVVHQRGSLARAVGLSMRLPGVAPPKWDDGRLHVDGGVLDNLPLGVMAEQREGPVIGVDVMRPFTVSGERGELPHIVDTIGRSMVLASWRAAASRRQLAHIVITPQLDGFGLFDFAHLDRIVEIGREAAHAVLPEVLSLLPRGGG